MANVYLEPVALLYGEAAREAVAGGTALPLAGGSIAFAAARIWERDPNASEAGTMTHVIARVATLLAIGDAGVTAMLDRITGAREPIASVVMDRTSLMGIVNVTPDSFSDGGEHMAPDAAVDRAKTLASEGAEIIDVGGESSRPGAETITVEEELSRILPVLTQLKDQGLPPVSIDTRKPEVMAAAVENGASILNDVSGLTFSAESLAEAVRLQRPVVIMHGGRDPKTMQANPAYENPVTDVFDFLERQIEVALAAGLPRHLIIADPGIGFAKSFAHNLAIMRSLTLFHGLGVPLLLGVSRKGMIGRLMGEEDAANRLSGSISAALYAAGAGVQVVRVHDVKATKQALLVRDAFIHH